jgi:hypothetical protein
MADGTTVRQRSLQAVRPDQLERRLRERLDALGPAPRAELLHVLMLPDFERADRIGEFWGYPESRAFAELLIHCGEDRGAASVLVGMLRDRAIEPAPHGEPGGLAQTRIAQRAALAGSQT